MEEENRIRDPGHTRALIIDAAERLFAERGFAATSMRDISAASGVSHPLIHHHYGSKEDLYVAVKRRMVEGYARRFPAAARATDRPLNVRAEMRRIMTYLSENPVMLRICGWTRLEGNVQLWPGEPDLLDTLRCRIEAAQRRGRIRDDLDSAALSLVIFGVIIFWVENRAHFLERFRGRMADDTYLRQAVALIERGIAKNPGERALAQRAAGTEIRDDGQSLGG
jgi:TetR/AcrR family transcriptional regulator